MNPIQEERRRQARQHQINLGKITSEYRNYREMIPKGQRIEGDPITPNLAPHTSCRSFRSRLRKWRWDLHEFNVPGQRIPQPPYHHRRT